METLAAVARGAAAVAATPTFKHIVARSTEAAITGRCTAHDLPSDSVLILNESTTITLTANAILQPSCLPDFTAAGANSVSQIVDADRTPFIASVIPQVFVLGSMLFLAWVLNFILIITPRTYFIVGSATGGMLGTRGMMGGTTGTSSVIGVGGRPWLQKAATLGVGISLLIATVNSFRVATKQYARGVEDAEELTREVVGSTEIQVIRIISFTFLWLAQIQTLIRLFPRHKEKIIIKWIGFALIFLDTLFAILHSVYGAGPTIVIPRDFRNAITALFYLFQFALNFVYLCAVLAYSWAKRRVAYYHPKMRNISVVAFISICSIFVPLVFFVLDSVLGVYGWGDYVRWVGAAAASVVVWEWVERVEALEREERKDGILGREIFDGDEAPFSSSTIDVRQWPKRRRLGTRKFGTSDTSNSGNSSDGKHSGDSGASGGSFFDKFSFSHPASMPSFTKLRRIRVRERHIEEKTPIQTLDHVTQFKGTAENNVLGRPSNGPIQPPQNVASPVSRADTTSAASTVYAVVHHPDSTTPPLPISNSLNATPNPSPYPQTFDHPATSTHDFDPALARNSINANQPIITQHKQITRPANPPPSAAPQGILYNPFSRSSIHNPFKRQRTAPPPEVTAAMNSREEQPQPVYKRKRDRLRFHAHQHIEPSELPTFTIPAREDGGAWSPRDSPEGTEYMSSRDGNNASGTSYTNASSPLPAAYSDIPGSSSADYATGFSSNPRSGSAADSQRVGINQMPSIDDTLNTHSHNANSASVLRTPSPAGTNSSTPSPRPSNGAERMPTLDESGHNGTGR